MGFNPDAVEDCPICDGQMKKGNYICARCSYNPIIKMGNLFPELREYDRPRQRECDRCEMEWLCKIWVFNLKLWSLCEIPDESDLMQLRNNGFAILC